MDARREPEALVAEHQMGTETQKTETQESRTFEDDETPTDDTKEVGICWSSGPCHQDIGEDQPIYPGTQIPKCRAGIQVPRCPGVQVLSPGTKVPKCPSIVVTSWN